jgi:hypothetical protein
MTRPPTTYEPAIVDVVTAVVIPMDGVTRRIVTTGVDVELWDPRRQVPVPKRLIRNRSGAHVLLNEPDDQELTFRLRPEAAGYRGPVLVTVNPRVEGISRLVPLERRPDADFGDVATLIRGLVVRADTPVAGAVVSARPPAPAGEQFPATTDERGVFALVVHLDEPGPVNTPVRVTQPGGATRDLTVELRRGRAYAFAAVIDLDRATPVPIHEIRS